MRKPIACSLAVADAHEQLAEWDRALACAVATRVRTDDRTLELRLRADADVAAIVTLAQREVACCPFFEFALRIDVGGTTFVATVPPDATTILDEFAAIGIP